MSSIRLFILGSLAERGPMHGHALRHLAEEEHIDSWTDFRVGAIYGAIKRLAGEGLIDEERVEREGNYPERQVYAITKTGRSALHEEQVAGLSEVAIKPDPFDLALARLDPDRLDELPDRIAERIRRMSAAVQQNEAKLAEIDHFLTVAEHWAIDHQADRWRAELAWHQKLLEALPEIISDERSRKENS